MLKKISFYLITLIGLFVLSSFLVKPTTISNVPISGVSETRDCSPGNHAFQDGEKVVYKLFYNWGIIWLSAGEVTFTVSEKEGSYHLIADGKTYPSYEWFFKVRDRYECTIDQETLLPLTSIRDVKEGKYILYDKMTWKHDAEKVVSLRGDSREKAISREFELKSCVHDLLSAIYHTRNLDLQTMQSNQTFPLDIFMDKTNYSLRVTYQGKENEKRIRGLGKFNTHKLSPELISGGVFEEGDEMIVWVSNDQNNLPLLVESPLSVGSVKAVLKSYEGLRHTLSSKLD